MVNSNLLTINRQLKAYNSKNLEEFIVNFSEDIKVYEFPEKLLYEGKDQFRLFYSQRFLYSNLLNCIINNRIILNEIIVDHEIIHGIIENPVEVIVLYSFKNNLIFRIDFLK
jgi:hypothetical protein